MKVPAFTEVDALKNEPKLYRALLRFRQVITLMAGAVSAGRVRLVGGRAMVSCPGLKAGTVVVVTHASHDGSPGLLLVDTASYSLSNGTFEIISTSTSDESEVAWHALT